MESHALLCGLDVEHSRGLETISTGYGDPFPGLFTKEGKAWLDRAQVVYFVCHGKFNSEDPSKSGLILEGE